MNVRNAGEAPIHKPDNALGSFYRKNKMGLAVVVTGLSVLTGCGPFQKSIEGASASPLQTPVSTIPIPNNTPIAPLVETTAVAEDLQAKAGDFAIGIVQQAVKQHPDWLGNQSPLALSVLVPMNHDKNGWLPVNYVERNHNYQLAFVAVGSGDNPAHALLVRDQNLSAGGKTNLMVLVPRLEGNELQWYDPATGQLKIVMQQILNGQGSISLKTIAAGKVIAVDTAPDGTETWTTVAPVKGDLLALVVAEIKKTSGRSNNGNGDFVSVSSSTVTDAIIAPSTATPTAPPTAVPSNTPPPTPPDTETPAPTDTETATPTLTPDQILTSFIDSGAIQMDTNEQNEAIAGDLRAIAPNIAKYIELLANNDHIPSDIPGAADINAGLEKIAVTGPRYVIRLVPLTSLFKPYAADPFDIFTPSRRLKPARVNGDVTYNRIRSDNNVTKRGYR